MQSDYSEYGALVITVSDKTVESSQNILSVGLLSLQSVIELVNLQSEYPECGAPVLTVSDSESTIRMF